MESTEPRRGDIWLVSFGAGRKGEPAKNRPAIVVSVDEILAGLEDELFVVVPLSTSRAFSALQPKVALASGIDHDSAAICPAVRAVVRTRLLQPIGRLVPETMREVERALASVLGLEPARA